MYFFSFDYQLPHFSLSRTFAIDMKIIECPRDAMQGLQEYIPFAVKAKYVSQLLKVGFDTIDFGSFVSPKAVPQMRDTADVLKLLDPGESKTKLLAIVANTRGAEIAAAFEPISYLGFPLSISETFQQRNTNKSIPEALNALEEIKNICLRANKKLVTYISMGFGNPYGDPYDASLVGSFLDILLTLGSDIVSLADTIGVSDPHSIRTLFGALTKAYPQAEIGVHLHSTPETAKEKIEAAYTAGCKRFDGAINGFGGCPMAKDELVGNLATESIINFLEQQGVPTGINHVEFNHALADGRKRFFNGLTERHCTTSILSLNFEQISVMNRLFIALCLLTISAVAIGQNAKDLTQKGRELYEKREFMEALLNINKALELDPNYAPAYFLRGNIKDNFDDRHGAMKDYNTAIEKNSKFADAYFARGNVKMKLQDYYGAIADFTSCIAINENNIEAYFNRGKAKQFLQAYQDAINDCSKIIQINPKNVDAFFMRGILRIEFGDMVNGCLDLSKAGELGDLKAYEVIKEKCNQQKDQNGND